MKRPFLLSAFLLLLLPGLSGCLGCNSQICDCFDGGENDIYLAFDSDSSRQGFRKAELAGAYVVRYARSGFTTALDTARIGPTPTYPSERAGFGVILNYVFRQQTTLPDVAANNYAIVLPRVSRRYQVAGIEIANETTGSRCCRCLTNTRKRVVLDGSALIADGNEGGPLAVLRR